jgi:hypothetical protein
MAARPMVMRIVESPFFGRLAPPAVGQKGANRGECKAPARGASPPHAGTLSASG